MTSRLRWGAAVPADLKIIEQTLIDKCGCIAAAARDLGVPSVDLRRLVASRPSLADVIYEGSERAIDEAVQVLLDGLSHPDKTQRLAAAAFLLRHTEAGRVAAGEDAGRRVAKPQSLRQSRSNGSTHENGRRQVVSYYALWHFLHHEGFFTMKA